jgi:hypothetical protein
MPKAERSLKLMIVVNNYLPGPVFHKEMKETAFRLFFVNIISADKHYFLKIDQNIEQKTINYSHIFEYLSVTSAMHHNMDSAFLEKRLITLSHDELADIMPKAERSLKLIIVVNGYLLWPVFHTKMK